MFPYLIPHFQFSSRFNSNFQLSIFREFDTLWSIHFNGVLKCWMFHDFFLIKSLLIEPLLRSGPLTIDPGVMVVKTINIQFPSSFFCLGPLLFKLELICGFISWRIKMSRNSNGVMGSARSKYLVELLTRITFFSQCCYV